MLINKDKNNIIFLIFLYLLFKIIEINKSIKIVKITKNFNSKEKNFISKFFKDIKINIIEKVISKKPTIYFKFHQLNIS